MVRLASAALSAKQQALKAEEKENRQAQREATESALMKFQVKVKPIGDLGRDEGAGDGRDVGLVLDAALAVVELLHQRLVDVLGGLPAVVLGVPPVPLHQVLVLKTRCAS